MKKVVILLAFLFGSNQLKADVFCAYAMDRFSNDIVEMQIAQTSNDAKSLINSFYYEDKNYKVGAYRLRYVGSSGVCVFVEAEFEGQKCQEAGVGETEDIAYHDAVSRLNLKAFRLGANYSKKMLCSKSFNF